MQHVNINGVSITIYTRQEAKKYARAYSYTDLIVLPNSDVAYGLLNKSDWLKAAGLDRASIDVALPQDWLNAQGRKSYEEIRAWYVWDYRVSILGKPLDVRTLKPQIVQAIMEALK
jgi:hypothetical protein